MGDPPPHDPGRVEAVPRRTRGIPGGVAGGLAVVGGLVTALASVLTWVNAEVDLSATGGPVRTETVGGLDTDDGKVTLVLGIAVVVFGIAVWAIRSRIGRRIFAALVVLAGGVAAAVGVIDLVTFEDEGIRSLAEQVVEQTGLTIEQAEVELRRLVSLSAGIGLYLVIVGGALAFVGGVLGLFPGREPPVPAPHPPPLAEAPPRRPSEQEPSEGGASPETRPPGTREPPPPPPPL